jgi:AcrR family transcriptional regulator
VASRRQSRARPQRARRAKRDGRLELSPRRQRRQERTRAAIRAAARAVLERKGYEQTTLRDVIDEADITHPTFYKYFRSKEDVLADLIDALVEELVATGSAFGFTRSPDPSVRRSFRLGWRAVLAVARKNRELLIAIRQAIHASEAHARRWRRFRSRVLEVVERDLRWGIRAGIIRCEHPKILSLAMLSIMETALFEFAGAGEEEHAAVEDVLESFFWSGLVGWQGAPSDYVLAKGKRPRRIR